MEAFATRRQTGAQLSIRRLWLLVKSWILLVDCKGLGNCAIGALVRGIVRIRASNR